MTFSRASGSSDSALGTRASGPGAADSEGLSRVSSFADWYQNRFTRVLLVGVAGTIGGVLGALVGAVLVFSFS